MIQTDIIIIGAGPVGLFTVFEAGLLKLKCHLIDALPIPGGQCAEIYPKKPIYDIPGYPSIQAAELIDKLMEQIKPFNPGFTLGETAYSLEKDQEEQFIVTTSEGTSHRAPVIAIAGGLGVEKDAREDVYNNVSNFTMDDLEAFHNEHISGNEYTILVLGSKEELDMGALAEYGEVKFLTLEDIFGY